LRHIEVLCEILAGHTQTPDRCWFAIWEGYGSLPGLRELDVPRLAIPRRDMLLLNGALASLPSTSFEEGCYQAGWDNDANAYRSPSLWWPDDHSWCVASDTDLQSSYIGASARCVRQLLDDSPLEVLPVDADQSVTMDADTITPSQTASTRGRQRRLHTQPARAGADPRRGDTNSSSCPSRRLPPRRLRRQFANGVLLPKWTSHAALGLTASTAAAHRPPSYAVAASASARRRRGGEAGGHLRAARDAPVGGG
jgi:hypothetical protein